MINLKSRVVETLEEFESLKSSWNALLSASGSDSPFLTFECLRACWRSYSGMIDPFVLVIESRGEIVGLVPLAVHRKGVSRVVRFLGNGCVDYQDLILHPEWRGEAFTETIDVLKRMRDRWDVIDLRNLREDSPNRDFFDRYARSSDAAAFKAYDVSPSFKVTGDWESYLGTVKKKLRIDTERQVRRLERLGETRVIRARLPEEIDPVLDWYHRQKRDRAYRDTVARDPFGGRRGRSYLRSFARESLTRGWLALDHLSIGGIAEPLAISISFVYRDRFFYWLPSISSDYLAYSPGRILLVSLLRESFRENRVEFDFLNGGEPYKYHWLAEDRAMYRLSCYGEGMKGFFWRGWVENLRPRLRRSDLLTHTVRLTRKMLETGTHD